MSELTPKQMLLGLAIILGIAIYTGYTVEYGFLWLYAVLFFIPPIIIFLALHRYLNTPKKASQKTNFWKVGILGVIIVLIAILILYYSNLLPSIIY